MTAWTITLTPSKPLTAEPYAFTKTPGLVDHKNRNVFPRSSRDLYGISHLVQA